MTDDWTTNAVTPATALSIEVPMPTTSFGTIISCYGFLKAAASIALNVEQIDALMCVGSKEGAGYI